MNSSLNIQPLFPLWAIFLGALILLTFLVWKEIERKIRFLSARITAVLFMILSIVASLLQPTRTSEMETDGAILLTKNYDRAKADSLVKKYPTLAILCVNEAIDFKDARILQPYELFDYKSEIAYVLGDGLPAYEERIISTPYAFIPSKLPIGVTQLTIPANVHVGQMATISGTVNTEGRSTLILKGPSQAEDSITLKGAGLKSFSLSFESRQAGLFQYSLTMRDSLNDETEERLPIEIRPEEKLNILFIQKYPTAEVRYLKNYLSEKGHAITVRSQISRTNFHYEYSNHESIRIDRLTPEILESFDLLFLDSESLSGLSASELKNLEQSCREGLGAILFINSADTKNKIPLLNASASTYAQDTVRLKGTTTSFVLPATPVSIVTSSVTTPIIISSNRTLSGYVNVGAGKIGFQLLHETYRLLLEGKENDYASLWSPLLEATTRLKPQQFKIQLDNQFPYYSDEPLLINVIAASVEPILKSENTPFPLQEDVIVDDYWHTTTWAGKAGWHQLHTQDSTQLNYFVAAADEWQTLRIANQHRHHISRSTFYSERAQRELTSITKPIFSLLFFIIFLLASGFLWLAPKL
ncbi:MAG: hypothetical protein U5K54_16465 [Cytophagales bacterium]|nr:hypothetical protein [Cytophagales bacterium]